MTEELKNKLKENGVDLNATMARFMGMEAMYKKFLFRFTDDPNYGELKKCPHLKGSSRQSGSWGPLRELCSTG